MASRSAWTRNQKIALWAVVVSAVIGVGGFIGKIQISIGHLSSEIETLKADYASIGSITTTSVVVRGTGTNSFGMPLVISNKDALWRFSEKECEFEQFEGGKWVTRLRITSTGLVTNPVVPWV
jgi:hypothetical protein